MTKKERDDKIKYAKAWAEVYHYDTHKTALYTPLKDSDYKLNPRDYIDTGKPYFYILVTRVKHHTSALWMKWRNDKVNDGRKYFVTLPTDKPNWLILNRNFKRRQERLMRILEYLEERKLRNKRHQKTY